MNFAVKKRSRPATAVASLFAAATSEEPSEAPSAEPATLPAPPPAAVAAAAPPATRVGAYRFGRRYAREKREPLAASGVARLRSIEAFEREGDLGAGAMARVFRARERDSGASVAIKAFKSFSIAALPDEAEAEDEIGGVPLEVLRECALLRSFRHPNIVRAHEVLTAPAGRGAALYLSMEAVDYDLGLLIEHMAQPFSEGQVKGLAHQLLNALAALEALGIVHRDLKQTNLLIDKDGVLRLADFGLARRLPASAEPLTPDVTSLWYRAPEVLLGAHSCERRGRAPARAGYGAAVDAWAFGVLTSEWLRKGEPLLSGHSELDQLQRIFRLLGAPTAASWPALFDGASLPRARLVALAASAPELTVEALDAASGASVRMPRSQLRRLLPLRGFDPALPSTAQLATTGLSTAGFECVAGCLELDPRRRPLASDALRHRWFEEAPLAESLTRFDMRALSRARTAAVSSGAHAMSIALQHAQRAATVASAPAGRNGGGAAATFGVGAQHR